jgi:molecular chaperone GrpE
MTDPQHDVDDEAENVNEATSNSNAPGELDPAAQIASLKDQVLRALAEAENTRRRAQKEREDTAKYAVANFAKEMLNVSDNFRRALEAVPKEDHDPALKTLMTGIEATERQLQSALERFGIKKLSPLGQAFDPNFHRVMMEVQTDDKPAGTVVQVLQEGYAIHDRLLREALVAVAKGGAGPKVDQSA